MLGSLFLALGIASCNAAGGNCDSPSTQLVRAEQQQQAQPQRQPEVTISDELDAPGNNRAASPPR